MKSSRLWFAVAVAASVAAPSPARAGLVAITATHLVAVDPVSLTVSPIGLLNLPSGYQPYGLTYHTANAKLYAYAGIFNTTNSGLFEIDPLTGQATQVADLGPAGAFATVYETLEYVDSFKSLVVSAASGGNLLTMGTDGTTAPLVSGGGRDADFGAYDVTRDRFYTFDPNGAGQFVSVDLTTGAGTNLGGLTTLLGDVGFSTTADAFFGTTYVDTNFYRLTTTNGGGPIAVTLLGQLPGTGAEYLGFSFIPVSVAAVPEPASVALLGVGAAGLLGYARRRRASRD